MNIRTKSFEFGEKTASTEQEHTAIPVILPASKITFGCGHIRLLDKLRNRKGPTLFGPTAYIAIARLGMGWHYTEGHQFAGFGMRDRLLYRGSERHLITNDMISSQHQYQGVFNVTSRLQCDQSSQCNSGSSIARGWLENNVISKLFYFTKLLCNQKTVLFVTDYQRLGTDKLI